MKVDSVIKEKNADAMAWVTFFDPAHYGLHGDWAENGFRIRTIDSAGNLFERAGLQQSDVVTAVGDTPATSATAFRRLLRKAIVDDEVFTLRVRRGKELREIVVEPLTK
jgi:hypothetical protein